MDESSVIAFLEAAHDRAIPVCVDGGWAVDAVLGFQSRPHNDLDIALPASDVPRLVELLVQLGFAEAPREDSWEHNFVYEGPGNQIVDVHSYILDA